MSLKLWVHKDFRRDCWLTSAKISGFQQKRKRVKLCDEHTIFGGVTGVPVVHWVNPDLRRQCSCKSLFFIRQAEEARKQGNEAMKAGKHLEAVIYYTTAIKHDPRNHEYYSNRSFALLKSDQFFHARNDALKAIELKPDWPKVNFIEGKLPSQYGGIDGWQAHQWEGVMPMKGVWQTDGRWRTKIEREWMYFLIGQQSWNTETNNGTSETSPIYRTFAGVLQERRCRVQSATLQRSITFLQGKQKSVSKNKLQAAGYKHDSVQQRKERRFDPRLDTGVTVPNCLVWSTFSLFSWCFRADTLVIVSLGVMRNWSAG